MLTKTYTEPMDITLSGRVIKCDYGVPRSPEWNEIEVMEIETAHMFGRDWTEEELRSEFGNLADWIVGSADDEGWGE